MHAPRLILAALPLLGLACTPASPPAAAPASSEPPITDTAATSSSSEAKPAVPAVETAAATPASAGTVGAATEEASRETIEATTESDPTADVTTSGEAAWPAPLPIPARPTDPVPDVVVPDAPEQVDELTAAIRAGQIEAKAVEAMDRRDWDAVLDLARRAVGYQPESPTACALYLRALSAKGLRGHAAAFAIDRLGPTGLVWSFRKPATEALLAAGAYDTALKAAATGSVPHNSTPEHRFVMARVQALRGKWDVALRWLERAKTVGFRDVSALGREPAFTPLAGDPRFLSILEAVRVRSEEPEPTQVFEANKFERTSSFPLTDLLDALDGELAKTEHPRFAYHGFDVHGKPLASSRFDDRIQVVFAWAHWSMLATEMLPVLADLEATFSHLGLSVVIVSPDLFSEGENFLSYTRKIADDLDLSLPLAVLPDHESKSVGVIEVPRTYLVGRGARLYLHAPGPLEKETLEALVERLVTAEVERARTETDPSDAAPEGDATGASGAESEDAKGVPDPGTPRPR